MFFSDADFSISRVVELPVSVVHELQARSERVNGGKLRITQRLLARSDVLDRTSEVRDVLEKRLDIGERDAVSAEYHRVAPPEPQFGGPHESLTQARVLNYAPDGVRAAAEALADYVEKELSEVEHPVVDIALPSSTDLLWPTLRAARGLGDSARTGEINREVIEREAYSEEQQAILHGQGPRTEIDYRLGWARTYLKGMGLLENTSRGAWSVTDLGRGVKRAEILRLYDVFERYMRAQSRERRAGNQAQADPRPGAGDPIITLLWPSGDLQSARTWDELESQLRGGWNPSDPVEFRAAMRRRAKIWFGATVPERPMTSEEFLRALADARLFALTPECPEGEDAIRRLRDGEWATPYAGIQVFRGGADFWKIYSEAGHYGHKGLRTVEDALRWAKIFAQPQYQRPSGLVSVARQ
jgi:hypothetical protein